jgi:hypothetical protein
MYVRARKKDSVTIGRWQVEPKREMEREDCFVQDPRGKRERKRKTERERQRGIRRESSRMHLCIACWADREAHVRAHGARIDLHDVQRVRVILNQAYSVEREREIDRCRQTCGDGGGGQVVVCSG